MLTPSLKSTEALPSPVIKKSDQHNSKSASKSSPSTNTNTVLSDQTGVAPLADAPPSPTALPVAALPAPPPTANQQVVENLESKVLSSVRLPARKKKATTPWWEKEAES